MSADPEPEKRSLRLSPAEKLLLKSQLVGECFSVPMEKEMPTYWWYLPKEEEVDSDFPLLQSIGDCMFPFDDPKTEPCDEEYLRDQIKEEPMDDEMMFGTDGNVYAGLMEGEMMDTINIDLAQENASLKASMEDMRTEHNERMVNLITRASDTQAMDRARIEELTLRLAQYQKGLHLQHQPLLGKDVVVIEDEESTSEHPIVRNGNGEGESVRSPEVIELEQKLLKVQFELNFERVCRETEKRIMKELEIKLEDASKKLENAATRELKAFSNIRDLVHQNKALQNVMTRECQRKDSELTREKEVLNEEVADLKRTISQVMDINRTLQERIGQLDLILAQYEEEPQLQQHLLQPLLQQQLLLLLPPPVILPPTRARAASLPPEKVAENALCALAQMKGVELHDTGHPTNLFQLCLPIPIESIPFQSACYELGKLAVTMDKRLFNDCCEKMLLKETMILHCDLCKKALEKFEIIEHFLSPRHIREMFLLGAAISSAAFKFWMHTLKKAAVVAADGRQVQQPTDATAENPSQIGRRLRIDHLNLNLLQYDDISHRPLQFSKQNSSAKAAETFIEIREAAAPEATISLLGSNMESHQIGDPPNIFHLCRLDSWNAISYEKAREKLLSVEREGQTLFQGANKLFERSPQLKTLAFYCQACDANFHGVGMILHFVGIMHQSKLAELGATVSRTAFEYWMDKLQSEPAATAAWAAQSMQQSTLGIASFGQPNAATAATDGEPNEVIVLDD